MYECFNSLLKGDIRIVEYCQNVKKLWTELLKTPDASDEDSLAKILHLKQFEFEMACGNDKSIGKELMAMVGILQFHDDSAGFERESDKAMFVYNAIKKSSCSLEVKFTARLIAKQYHLIDENEHD